MIRKMISRKIWKLQSLIRNDRIGSGQQRKDRKREIEENHCHLRTLLNKLKGKSQNTSIINRIEISYLIKKIKF